MIDPRIPPEGYPAFGETERATMRPRFRKGKGQGSPEDTHFVPRGSEFSACGYHASPATVLTTDHPYWSDCRMCRMTDDIADAQDRFDKVHGSYEQWREMQES